MLCSLQRMPSLLYTDIFLTNSKDLCTAAWLLHIIIWAVASYPKHSRSRIMQYIGYARITWLSHRGSAKCSYNSLCNRGSISLSIIVCWLNYIDIRNWVRVIWKYTALTVILSAQMLLSIHWGTCFHCCLIMIAPKLEVSLWTILRGGGGGGVI